MILSWADLLVIASGAKQSSIWRQALDCFVAFAPRNDDLVSTQSMIPKSGCRFSVKIMLKLNNLDSDPIQLNWITV
jgi:hypothetical protein